MGFFDAFTGKAQRREIEAAKGRADNALTAGYNEASGLARTYGDEAMGYLTPYMQSGERSRGLYEDSIGMNGAAGGRNALTAYQGARNPFLDYQMDQAQRGIDRSANARGMVNSGANALAAARARQEMGYKDYAGWQDRLGQYGQQGYSAAATGAGLRQNQGQYLSGLRYGYGQTQAGNEINYGNAQAQAQGIGWNNLFRIGEVAAKAAAGMM